LVITQNELYQGKCPVLWK